MVPNVLATIPDLNARTQKAFEEKDIDRRAYKKVTMKKMWKYCPQCPLTDFSIVHSPHGKV